jgi:hypothetical protein
VIPERQYGGQEFYEPYSGLKKLIGLILIVGGVIIALWAIVNVYKIFTNPQEIEVFSRIIPDSPEIRKLDIGGTKVILPEGLFLFMAYSIGCFLLFIAASIATALITGGVNLLQSSFLKLETRITKEMVNLKKTIEEVKETFTKTHDSA